MLENGNPSSKSRIISNQFFGTSKEARVEGIVGFGVSSPGDFGSHECTLERLKGKGEVSWRRWTKSELGSVSIEKDGLKGLKTKSSAMDLTHKRCDLTT